MCYGQNKRKGNIIDVLLKASKKGNTAVLCQQNPSAIYANNEYNVRTYYITQIIVNGILKKLAGKPVMRIPTLWARHNQNILTAGFPWYETQ